MTTPLTDADVKRIAGLARLELSPTEIEMFTRQLADILAYADEIQQVDTTDVPATSHVLSGGPSWRPDLPAPSLTPDDVLRAAPGALPSAGVFRVPKVI
jgi:aspartyl-tRNA(Asn)/glutamyl-tRNA(Gln) amidotransferase subunit C